MKPIPAAVAKRYRAEGHWRGKDLWTAFEVSAGRAPERIALVCHDRSLTFAETAAAARRLGTALASRGIGTGDVVVIHARNGMESTLAMLACAWCGAVFAPLPPMFSETQIAAVAQSSEARAVFCLGTATEAPRAVAAAAATPTVGLVVTLSGAAGTLSFDTLLAEGAGVEATRRGPVDPGALAMLVYSSGTTGTPKGIMHAADTICYAVEKRAAMHSVGQADRCLIVCQFGFVGGIVFGTLSSLLLGCTGVVLPAWDADAALSLIAGYGITYGLFMPTHVHDLLHAQTLARADLSTLSRAAMGGLSQEQRREVAARLTPTPLPGYGMSECLGNTTCSPDDAPQKRLIREGRPYPGTEILVVDSDGRPCAPGEVGSILVRGPSRCLGYYRAEAQTEAAFTEDGFFRTGDLGSLDEEGFLSFAGREKDIIRRGSVTIVPGEVEAVLVQHPRIRHAAVVAVPDQRFGEIACACIVPEGEALDLDAVTAFLAERSVARYQWPQRVAIFEEFPRTPSLKVQKAALVDQLKARTGSIAS